MSLFDQESPNFVPIGPSVPVPPPPFDGPPYLIQSYYRAVHMREISYQALEKATVAGKSYNVEGMTITRYDLPQLQTAYTFWDDQVNTILRHGSNSTMKYRRIIPLDLF